MAAGLRRIVISEGLRNAEHKQIVSDHLKYSLRNPEPSDSSLARAMKKLRFIPTKLLTAGMLKLGYNGIVLEQNGKAMGHIFFQKHNDALHVFNIWVEPSMRRKGLPSELLGGFADYVTRTKGIKSIKLGKVALARYGRIISKRVSESGKARTSNGEIKIER